LIILESAMFKPRVILHPTDYSDTSDYALQIAADLARLHQATILVLHVAETLGPENVTYGEAVSQLEPTAYRRRLEEDLRRQIPPPSGVSIQYLLAGGDPAQEIDRAAREHHCDLIVMGSHGRTGLSRLLAGSIAEEVIRTASCPVLVIKIPLPNAASAR
jgi:nucleotide-binding universal stress UspA family protein